MFSPETRGQCLKRSVTTPFRLVKFIAAWVAWVLYRKNRHERQLRIEVNSKVTVGEFDRLSRHQDHLASLSGEVERRKIELWHESRQPLPKPDFDDSLPKPNFDDSDIN